MLLAKPKIVAPDSSHWAKWLDAAFSKNADRRLAARALHDRLLEQDCIPFLSWHHVEELVSIGNASRASARVEFLQSLPLLAWFRFSHENAGLGSIVDILAAEAIAVSEGCQEANAIREHARSLLLQIGLGSEAVGSEIWPWTVARPEILKSRSNLDLVATFSDLRLFDSQRTVGDVSQGRLNSPEEMATQFHRIKAVAIAEAKAHSVVGLDCAIEMANEFISKVEELIPQQGTTVREFIVTTLVEHGVDAEEITDDSVLADLIALATFRTQLRIVARKTGRQFDALKRISMSHLPSRILGRALKEHAQPRGKRRGSDVTDGYLAVLSAYVDVVYVDKRTWEDFRRVLVKEPALRDLIGKIRKAADFPDLVRAVDNQSELCVTEV